MNRMRGLLAKHCWYARLWAKYAYFKKLVDRCVQCMWMMIEHHSGNMLVFLTKQSTACLHYFSVYEGSREHCWLVWLVLNWLLGREGKWISVTVDRLGTG